MQIAEDARRSKYAVAKLGTNDKNRGILAIADTLMAHTDEIIAANRIDIENGRAAGLNDGLIDRLMLDEKRIAGIAEGCRQAADGISRKKAAGHGQQRQQKHPDGGKAAEESGRRPPDIRCRQLPDSGHRRGLLPDGIQIGGEIPGKFPAYAPGNPIRAANPGENSQKEENCQQQTVQPAGGRLHPSPFHKSSPHPSL